jgi:hypothetical protein
MENPVPFEDDLMLTIGALKAIFGFLFIFMILPFASGLAAAWISEVVRF